jgi:hypothetical protein
MKEYPETHQIGFLSIEKDLKAGGQMAGVGIQIAEDGRIWLCVNGEALIRFRPLRKNFSEESLT